MAFDAGRDKIEVHVTLSSYDECCNIQQEAKCQTDYRHYLLHINCVHSSPHYNGDVTAAEEEDDVLPRKPRITVTCSCCC